MSLKHLIAGASLAAALAGCAATSYAQERTPSSLLGESLRAQAEETGERFKTPVLHNLERGKNYVILIDAYDDVKQLSRLVGFSGDYGHIELVRNERAYGCRPPQCSEISLANLEKKFPNRKFEVREVEIKGSPEKATQWFKENLEGQGYDLLYRNCTDAVVLMYNASGDRTRRINPVDVDKSYAANYFLRKFMAEHGIPKPNRAEVFFPDQFTQIGKLVAKGKFLIE